MNRLGQALTMSWGKIRRGFLIAFRKKRVLEKLDRRRGDCTRCGACCKILFKCPAYDDADGVPKCLIYNDRPGVCGLFPLDEKDLRERNFVMPGRKCGYWFTDKERPAGETPKAEPVRWGPSGDGPGIRNGTLAIILSWFRKPPAR
jgi:hypothetical protein